MRSKPKITTSGYRADGLRVVKNAGKGGGSQTLPSRHALNTLTGGDPLRRTINQYSKATPAGGGGLGTPSILDMGKGAD